MFANGDVPKCIRCVLIGQWTHSRRVTFHIHLTRSICSVQYSLPPLYVLLVKIINPNKKKNVAVLYLNDFSTTFETVTSLCAKLIDTFNE